VGGHGAKFRDGAASLRRNRVRGQQADVKHAGFKQGPGGSKIWFAEQFAVDGGGGGRKWRNGNIVLSDNKKVNHCWNLEPQACRRKRMTNLGN